MKKAIISNQKGLTLVEVLAAIVIITLIILLLSHLLPMMARTNQVNEKKTEAIHYAKEQLIAWQDYFRDPKSHHFPELHDKNGNLVAEYQLENSYLVEVTIFHNDDYEKNSIAGSIEAHQIRVQIYDEQNNYLTETYGYIFTDGPLAETR